MDRNCQVCSNELGWLEATYPTNFIGDVVAVCCPKCRTEISKKIHETPEFVALNDVDAERQALDAMGSSGVDVTEKLVAKSRERLKIIAAIREFVYTLIPGYTK